MEEIDEIKRNLKSEAAKDRKLGRQACETLPNKDKTRLHLSIVQYAGIIQAVLEYEAKGIRKDKDKRKTVLDNSIASFVRKIVKHYILVDQMTVKRFYMIVNHCLDILQDNGIDKNYKDEHRHLLCDLLDMKCFISVKILKIENISLYLQDILQDKRSILDSMNMRLLKNYCKFIVRDTSSGVIFGKFADIILEWFSRLFSLIDNDDNVLKGLITTYAECNICIIDVYGINYAEILFKYIDVPLQIITRLLMTNQLTRLEKISILRFLLSYFQLSTSCHWNLSEPLASADPLSIYINEICISLLSDENMNSIISTLNSSWSTRKSKEPHQFLNGLDDPESRLNFEVICRACYIHQLQACQLKDNDFQSNKDNIDSQNEPLNKRQKLHASNTKVSHIDSIIVKIKFSILNPKYKSLVSNINFTTTTSPPSKYALEGYIFIIVMICKLFPKGEFLKMNERSEGIEELDCSLLRLYQYVVILKCKLFETIEASIENNQQLLGCILLALEGLAFISSNLGCETDSNSTHSKLLKTEWYNLLMQLLSDDRIRLILVTVTRNSLNERIIALANTVLSTNLLDTVSAWSLQNLLWQLNINSDPRLVDSPEYFSVLSSMLKFYQNEQSQTFCQTYLRNEQELSTSRIGIASGEIQQDHQHRLPLILSLDQNNGVLNSLNYMVSWLDIQLNSLNVKFNVINACSISKSFKEIIFTILGTSSSSLSNLLNDNDYNMAIDAKQNEYIALLMPHFGSYWSANKYYEFKQANAGIDTINQSSSNSNGTSTIFSASIITKCLEIFEILQNRLHTDYIIENRSDKRTEFSNWQMVSPILCSVYASIAEYVSLSSSTTHELMEVIMYDFYSLMSELVTVLKINFITLATRWINMSDYINFLSILLKKMGPFVSNTSPLRVLDIDERISEDMLALAQMIKDEVQSITAREGLESTSSSLHRESISNVAFDDDLDDDNDLMNIDDNGDQVPRNLSKYSQGDQLVPRIFFTKDQLDAFCATVRCFLLTGFDENRIYQVTDILGFNIQDPKSHFGDTRCKFWVPLEVFYTLLEHVSSTGKFHATELLLNKFFDASMKFFSKGFEEDISIKLFKCLGVCYELTKGGGQQQYYNEIPECIQKIIFYGVDDEGDNNAEYGYMSKIMRLKCVHNILMIPDLVTVDLKGKIRSVYISALKDSDIRVRTTAARTAGFLINIFAKKANAYLDLLENVMNVTLCFAPSKDHINSQENKKNYNSWGAVTVAIATASVCISNAELTKQSLFDLILTCSSREFYRSKNIIPNFNDLLRRLLQDICNALGYGSVKQLLLDYFRYLIKRWVLSPSLKLQQFPYSLLSENTMTYIDFIQLYSSLTIPIICHINSQERYRQILTYSLDLKGSSTDNDIARLLLDNLCPIKANEFVIYSASNRLSVEYGKNMRDIAVGIKDFLKTSINQQEIDKHGQSHIADTIHEVFYLLCFASSETFEGVYIDALVTDDDYIEEVIKLIIDTLTNISNKLEVENDVVSLLSNVNTIDLLATLRARIQETRHEGAKKAMLAGVITIMRNIDVNNKVQDLRSLIRAIISTLIAAIRCSPPCLNVVCKAITELSEIFAGIVQDDIGDSRVIDMTREFFCDILCLFVVIKMVRTKQDSLNSIIGDEFVSIYYSDLWSSLDLMKLSSRELDSTLFDLQRIMDSLLTLLITLEDNSLTRSSSSLESILPLPISYINAVSESTTKTLLESVLVSLDIRKQILDFNALTERVQRGESIPMPSLWLALNKLSIIFFNGTIKSEDLLKNDADLVVTLVSSLLSLSSSRVEPIKIFRRKIIEVIGLIGPPDLLTIDHDSLPSRQMGLINKSSADVVNLKLLLTQKLYDMLWDDSDISKEASSVLRLLSSNDVLTKQNLLDECLKRTGDFGWTNYALIKILPKIRPLLGPISGKHSMKVSIDPWSRQLWSTAGKSYNMWITSLTASLIKNCYHIDIDSRSMDVSSDSRLLIAGKDSFISATDSICLMREDFAEGIFPLIVFDLLEHNGPISLACDILSERLAELLSVNCSLKKATQLACDTLVFLLRQDIKVFRKQKRKKSKTDTIVSSKTNGFEAWKLPFSYHLNIDLKYAAMAALRCGYVCTALMLSELFDEKRKSALNLPGSMKIEADGDVINSELLACILKGIHDPDAVYGVNPGTNLHLQALMLAHTGAWMEALSTYESLLQSKHNSTSSLSPNAPIAMVSPEEGVANALRGLGAQHVLGKFTVKSNTTANTTGKESIFEMQQGVAQQTLRSWSTSIEKTEEVVFNPSASLPSSLSQYISGQIDACSADINRYDKATATYRINQCTESIVPEILNIITEESAQNLITFLGTSQQLVEIGEVIKLIFDNNAIIDDDEDVTLVLSKWLGRLEGCKHSTILSENILSLRLSLMKTLQASKKATPMRTLELMDHIQKLTKGKNVAHSLSPLVYCLRDIVFRSSSPLSSSKHKLIRDTKWNLYESRFLWDKGLHDVAMLNIEDQVIKKLKSINNNDKDSCNVLAEAYRTKGEWMTIRRSGIGKTILCEYLEPAINIAQSLECKIKSHTTLANFNARLYHSTKTRVSSAEWKLGKITLEHRLQDLEQSKKMQQALIDLKGKDHDEVRSVNRHVSNLSREVRSDKEERASIEKSESEYLLNAINQYNEVLTLSKGPDLEIVFKILNLWLSNCRLVGEVNEMIKKIVKNVSSFKFVPLVYQILSRLEDDSGITIDDSIININTHIHRPLTAEEKQEKLRIEKERIERNIKEFQKVLRLLIKKLCHEHPHHTLTYLFALANEGMVQPYTGSIAYQSNMSSGRIKAAKSIIQELKKEGSKCVDPLETLLLGYIELASASTETYQQSNRIKDISFKDLQGRKKMFNECLSNHTHCMPAVITANFPIRPDCDYGDIVIVNKILPTFSVTESGISRPKIIKIEGSNGLIYRQLVKGGDDVRQDAVMQQVFEHVNHTLQRVEETRKRKLGIRTYKIIPTTPQSGIIQWVEDTIAFGSYLTDNQTGAHVRYYPNDYPPRECRKMMDEAKSDARDMRLQKFKDICKKFRPVFRFFFLENYPITTEWMSRRLSYTRSVAVTSVVGYVLGIGDRHVHNILIDTTKGEVVHIDFGIAYEQGKTLGVPETVPFRLTRDVIDGFGVTGVEGTFKHSCHEVLRVLRDNSEQLLTILEVVVHDPLYKWCLSPVQARRRQISDDQMDEDFIDVNHDNNNDNGNYQRDTAERALTRIRSKLQGFDDPTGEALSVEGHLELLINDATDDDNLSKIFPGWSPWV